MALAVWSYVASGPQVPNQELQYINYTVRNNVPNSTPHSAIRDFPIPIMPHDHAVYRADHTTVPELKRLLGESLATGEASKHLIGKWSPAPSSTAVWKRFGPVFYCGDEGDEPIMVTYERAGKKAGKVVGCHECARLYVYDPADGTSTIFNHKCDKRVKAAASSYSMDMFAKPVVEATASQKKLVTVACADWIAEDMRPFHIVGGDGFANLLQTVLDIGCAANGPMKIESLLCTPTTVKRNVMTRFADLKERLVHLCQRHFADKLVAGSTLDIWTDPQTQTSYLSVTLHTINEYFILKARYDGSDFCRIVSTPISKLYIPYSHRTLQVDEFPGDMAHSGKNVKEAFESAIETFITIDVDDFGDPVLADSYQIWPTCDSASNNMARDSLPSVWTVEPCTCHRINTCITDVLDKKVITIQGVKQPPFYEFYDSAPDVFDLLDHCAEFVKWAKQSKYNKKFSVRTKQKCSTRWEGLLRMLQSIHDEYEQKYELLRGAGKLGRINKIEEKKSLLVELVRLLHGFKLASKTMEAFLSPTIHLVGFTRRSLLQHCEVVSEPFEVDSHIAGVPKISIAPDSDSIIGIKKQLTIQLKTKWVLRKVHAAAAFLDPRQKKRLPSFFPNDIIIEGMGLVRETMMRVGAGKPVVSKKRPAPKRPVGRALKRAPVPVAPARLSLDIASSEDESDEDDEQVVNHANVAALMIQIDLELHAYTEMKVASTTLCKDDEAGPSGPLLLWWQSKAKEWPILARAVRSILCIPAASARSENNFSDAGNTITEKRNQLKPPVVNALMFMRSNKDLKR